MFRRKFLMAAIVAGIALAGPSTGKQIQVRLFSEPVIETTDNDGSISFNSVVGIHLHLHWAFLASAVCQMDLLCERRGGRSRCTTDTDFGAPPASLCLVAPPAGQCPLWLGNSSNSKFDSTTPLNFRSPLVPLCPTGSDLFARPRDSPSRDRGVGELRCELSPVPLPRG